MYKTIETCHFKRTETSGWEHGFNLDDGKLIIDLEGNGVNSVFDLERRACDSPFEKSFSIQKVKGGLSIILVDSAEENVKPYDYIRAWGDHLYSYDGYIENEIAKARKDNAPYNAVYRQQVGKDTVWVTFDMIKSDDVKERIQRIVDMLRVDRGEDVPEPKRLPLGQWKTILDNLAEDDEEVEVVWLDNGSLDEPSEWALAYGEELFEDRFVSEKQATQRLEDVQSKIEELSQ